MAYTTKWKWKFMYSNESVYVCLYCVLYVLWPHSKHTDAVCKKKKNKPNGIWIKLIRKTSQCVFSILKRYTFFFLSFFLLIHCAIFMFLLGRSYIHYTPGYFFSLFTSHFFIRQAVRDACGCGCMIFKLLFYGYMLSLNGYTLQNITFNILKNIWEIIFFYAKKFPMKKRKLLRWFKFRCDGNNIKIFCFFFGTQKKSISMAIISIVVVERSHSVNIYIHWFTDKRIDKIRLGGK